MRLPNPAALALVCALTPLGTALAQFRGGPEWNTAGADAQRSSWIRSDAKISVDRVRQPGFALAWKIKLNAEPGLAATLSSYIGYRGFRSYAFLGGPSGDLTAIDTDLGRIEWQKKIPGAATRGSAPCSGAMTSNLARNMSTAFPATPTGRGGGGGRGGAAKSDAGKPNEGAVTIAAAEAAANAAAANAAARGGRGRGGFSNAPPGGRGPRRGETIDAIASDGTLHSMYVSNGEEPNPPIPFVPAHANVHDLGIVNEIAYAATSQGCGGAPNAVWALDIASKDVVHWSPVSGDIAGGGFAFGPDGKLYAATTAGDMVALDPKKLEVAGVYRADNQSFNAPPVIFERKTKAFAAAPTSDGHIHLVDAAAMTGAAFSGTASGALAAWTDGSGVEWLLGPSKNSIAAWKVSGEDTPSLQPGWTSAELSAPLSPIIVNGVVFVVANSPNAVLHALDGTTGKELWNSGKTMTAPVKAGGLSGSGSQLYIGTSDGTVYAFGFPIEH